MEEFKGEPHIPYLTPELKQSVAGCIFPDLETALNEIMDGHLGNTELSKLRVIDRLKTMDSSILLVRELTSDVHLIQEDLPSGGTLMYLFSKADHNKSKKEVRIENLLFVQSSGDSSESVVVDLARMILRDYEIYLKYKEKANLVYPDKKRVDLIPFANRKSSADKTLVHLAMTLHDFGHTWVNKGIVSEQLKELRSARRDIFLSIAASMLPLSPKGLEKRFVRSRDLMAWEERAATAVALLVVREYRRNGVILFPDRSNIQMMSFFEQDLAGYDSGLSHIQGGRWFKSRWYKI